MTSDVEDSEQRAECAEVLRAQLTADIDEVQVAECIADSCSYKKEPFLRYQPRSG